jgi:N-acetylneuraminate synthase
VLDTRRPVLLSTGMSPSGETDAAVARVKARGSAVGVLQCTTAYPCPPRQVGLNLVPFYRERYGCWVGLSDHSATIYPGLAAAAVGLDMLEVHVALSREMFGPDVVASVTTPSCGSWWTASASSSACARTRSTRTSRHDAPSRCVDCSRAASWRPYALAPGTYSTRHLAVKKPGTGLPPERLADLVGRTLRRRVAADQLLAVDDIEGFLS